MSFCSLFFRGIFFNCSECRLTKTENMKRKHNTITQLFEGRLVLNPWLNLTQASFLFQSIFSNNFLCYFSEHPVRLSQSCLHGFWSGVVGPGTNDFYPLQRAKFTGGKFLL